MATGKEIDVQRPQCKRILLNLAGEHVQCKRISSVNGEGYCSWCFSDLKKSLPRYARAVEARKVERAARDQLDVLFKRNNVNIEVRDFEDDFNPLTALLDIAQEQLAFKELCLAKLAKLQEDEWRWDGDRAGEQLRSEIVMYERAIERATNTLVRIGRLGIEERLTRVAERQVAIVETAIVRTLQELDLSPDQQARARERIIRHLKSA